MGDKHDITDLTRGLYRKQYANFLTGKRMNALSLEAEAWFWRLHAVVDDFGNFHADPALVCDATRGLRRQITDDKVAEWLAEMKKEGLITYYKADGERFLHIVEFVERQPAGKNGKRIRRFPEFPPDASGGIQVNPNNPGESSASKAYEDEDENEDDYQDDDDSQCVVDPFAVSEYIDRIIEQGDDIRQHPNWNPATLERAYLNRQARKSVKSESGFLCDQIRKGRGLYTGAKKIRDAVLRRKHEENERREATEGEARKNADAKAWAESLRPEERERHFAEYLAAHPDRVPFTKGNLLTNLGAQRLIYDELQRKGLCHASH